MAKQYENLIAQLSTACTLRHKSPQGSYRTRRATTKPCSGFAAGQRYGLERLANIALPKHL